MVFVSSCHLFKHPNVEASYLVAVPLSWLQLAKLPAFNLAIIYLYFSPATYTSNFGFPTISTCRKLFIVFPSTTSQIPLSFSLLYFETISLTSFILNFSCT